MKTSHAKQVAAFEQLIGFCNAHGASYNPSKSSIRITALEAMLKQAKGSLEAVTTAKVDLMNEVNRRQRAFEGIPKLATRIVNALAASDPAPGVFDDVMVIKRKFTPKYYDRPAISSGNAPMAEGNEAGTKTELPIRHSTSQLDFVTKASNFGSLIQLLKLEPSYQPNETALQIATLDKFVTTLREKNTAIMQHELVLSNIRIDRNRLLYQKDGIHGTAMSVKRYIRSVYGARSDEFRQIARLFFKKEG